MSDDAEYVFPKKYNNIISKMPEFKDLADSADTEELKRIIVECEGNLYTIEKEMSEDIKLNSAKELVKEYSELYRDGIKAQVAKVKYALFLLDGRGEDLDNK